MKKIKKITAIIVGAISLGVSAVPVSAATTAILDWHLVGEDKHMDWTGNSQFLTDFVAGTEIWNNYKPDVIRKAEEDESVELTLSDFSEVSAAVGVTSSRGTIKFNSYYMKDYSSAQRQNVCGHELGHALGLDHNQEGDIMYAAVTDVITLSENDKASYDASYARY